MSEQRSAGWYAARAGRITASRFGDAAGFWGPAARAKYMRELCFERLAGRATHEISGKALAWGTDLEPFHREAIELETGLIVLPAEFVVHAAHPFIGASPDGLIGTDGGLEMKSPHDEAVHIETLLNGMPAEHRAQVQGNMAVTGRRWWLFASYDPRQAEPYRLYTGRVARDDIYIAKLMGLLLAFEDELREMVAQIQRRSGKAAA